MMWLISLFARWGVGERLQRPLAYLTTGIALIALAGVLWAIFDARERADDASNQQIGARIQRETDLRETINRVGKADEVRVEIRRPGSRVQYDSCVQSARTPANCQRFLPD